MVDASVPPNRDVRAALASLREQLEELDDLQLPDDDEQAAALRKELEAAIAEAEHTLAQQQEEEDDPAVVPHSAAFGNAGIHPRNRCTSDCSPTLSLACADDALVTAGMLARLLTSERWQTSSRCCGRLWCAFTPCGPAD
jgi:hypothetical protein